MPHAVSSMTYMLPSYDKFVILNEPILIHYHLFYYIYLLLHIIYYLFIIYFTNLMIFRMFYRISFFYPAMVILLDFLQSHDLISLQSTGQILYRMLLNWDLSDFSFLMIKPVL